MSSRSGRNPQPDCRALPKKKYRNHDNDDSDERNRIVPYSRLIWEVHWKNINPLDIRRSGKVLMKSPYNRLYLVAKIFGFDDDDDGKMEAAIVLWGRGEGNVIEVMRAVSYWNEPSLARKQGRICDKMTTFACWWVSPGMHGYGLQKSSSFRSRPIYFSLLPPFTSY